MCVSDFGGAEDFDEAVFSVLEYSFDVAADEEPVYQRAATGAVADIVVADGAIIAFFKGVGVLPEGIWTAQLHVFKTVGRVPLGYLGPPTDWNAMNANLVVNKNACAHFDWRWREDFKAKPRRREGFKIGGVAKEVEDPVAGRRKPDFRVKREFVQRRPLMPGFDATGARDAPATQGFYRGKNTRDAEQDRQPERRTECETRPDKKTQRDDCSNDSALLINVGSKESFHVAE